MINKFEGKYSFLSNFYSSPISDGIFVFPTVEHYFQAYKTMVPTEREAIAHARNPGEAKRFGRHCTLRADWESIKEKVMYKALQKKFSIPELKMLLLATEEEELEEGTWWHDNYWGNCYCEKCKNIEGKNILGKMLMKIRSELK